MFHETFRSLEPKTISITAKSPLSGGQNGVFFQGIRSNRLQSLSENVNLLQFIFRVFPESLVSCVIHELYLNQQSSTSNFIGNTAGPSFFPINTGKFMALTTYLVTWVLSNLRSVGTRLSS